MIMEPLAAQQSLRNDKMSKSAMQLIEPDFLVSLGNVLRNGAQKYAPRAWRQEPNPEVFIAATLRHITEVMKGHFIDDDGEWHVVHAAANLMFLQWFSMRGWNLDDIDTK
jgi:hypothetical protein